MGTGNFNVAWTRITEASVSLISTESDVDFRKTVKKRELKCYT